MMNDKNLWLRKIGDKSLRTISNPIIDINHKEIYLLVDQMIKIMQNNNGIGLAAPQLGISKRLIIISYNDTLMQYIYDTNININTKIYKNVIVLINPNIILINNKQVATEEGCLSIPKKYAIIQRYKYIHIKSKIFPSNELINFNCKELLSIILQHEIDHLNGILFTDKIN